MLPVFRAWLAFLAVPVMGMAPARGEDGAGGGAVLNPWKAGVQVAPVLPESSRHTMHAYYTANPESTDGRSVLYFSSTDVRGEVGDVCMVDRATGRETVLAAGVQAEDAHRAACQQWLAGGKLVAFHEAVEGGKWRVVVVDVASGVKKVIAEDRQLGFGSPEGSLLPLYGCHWNPGEHRDLELWDAETGKIRTAVRVSEVLAGLAGGIPAGFGSAEVSIFFPVLSPDRKRVMFKLAAGRGGTDFRSKNASVREGLLCCDLESGKLLWSNARWGHPAWHPDSRQILQVGYVLFDTESGGNRQMRGPPVLRGTHLSLSPDARWITADGFLGKLGATPTEWGVLVADAGTGDWQVIHRFENGRGARSWRRSDPHPVFSADGKRIYFNVSDGAFTRLFVASSDGHGPAMR